MTDTPISRTTAVLGVVSLLLVAAAGGALAASYDNSTTDATSSTSDIVAGDTLVLGAGANGTSTVEGIVENGTTPELRFVHDGTVIAENTSMVNITVGSSGTHWNGTVENSSLLDVPVAAGGNVSVQMKLVNASNTSDVLLNETIYIKSDGTYATVQDKDVTRGPDTAYTVAGMTVWDRDTQRAAESEQDADVTSNTTQVRFAPQNASMQEAVGAQVDAHEDSSPLWTVQMKVGDSFVPVVAEGQDLPPWLEEDDEHAVAQSDGTVVLKNAEFDSDENVTVGVVGSEKLSALTQVDVMQDYDVGAMAWYKASIDYNGNPDELEVAS